MGKPASREWIETLQMIQGMWPGKRITFFFNTKEEADQKRNLVFNAAQTIKPKKPKICTRINGCEDGKFSLEVTKEKQK